MNKIILPVIVFLAFASCEKKTVSTKPIVSIDSNKIYFDSATIALDQANILMTKGLKNELSKEEVNKKLEPIMKKFMLFQSKISGSDSTLLNDYRMKKVNEIIELQMKLNQ